MALIWLYRFIRFPALSFTALLPLLGGATVASSLDARMWTGLLGVAVTFHTFAYVLNDVIDLRIDCTEPWRVDYPLVEQSIRPHHALGVALVQVPFAFLLAVWTGDNGSAHGALAAAFTLMTIYNLFGKRCAYPLLTDAVQGLAWSALASYGALMAGGRLDSGSVLLMAHVFLCVMMINGVHGGLRDLDNDSGHGARTTALFFGAHHRGGRLILPRRFAVYVLVLQGALVSVTVLRLTRGWPPDTQGMWAIAAGLTLGLTAIAFGVLVQVRRALGALAVPLAAGTPNPSLGLLGAIHLVASTGVLPSLYGLTLGGPAAAGILAVFAVPILAMWAHNGSQWD